MYPTENLSLGVSMISERDLSGFWLNKFRGIPRFQIYYNGSAEGHEYPDLQVGDEVNPRPIFVFSYD